MLEWGQDKQKVGRGGRGGGPRSTIGLLFAVVGNGQLEAIACGSEVVYGLFLGFRLSSFSLVLHFLFPLFGEEWVQEIGVPQYNP